MTWTSHPARLAMPCLAIVLIILGLLAGRAEMVILATPLIIAGGWSLVSPQSNTTSLAVTDKAARISIESPTRRPVTRLRLTCAGHRATTVLIGPGRDHFEVRLHSVRTGLQPRLRADWDLQGRFLLTFSQTEAGLSEPVVVLPSYLPLGLTPRSTQLRGLTGPLDSRRPGDGFELRDIHPMRPGDARHRIDWRATARQPSMDFWVRGTYATGEPVAVLLLDSRDEVGPDLHTWRGALALRVDEVTSLDLARHAAASIARTLIDSGDRVGLADLATGRRLLAPATGARHLERLTHALALSAPVGSPLT
ncbi:MAG: DUF58 domain-containing protein, partial [Propionibacteriaceae bacterium]|nr:DUF58 domain-containing protein [Propionibacteriaceae bacterium]